MARTSTCSSCGEGLIEDGFSIFACPSCGEQEIGRCNSCREHSTKYFCPSCSFEGP